MDTFALKRIRENAMDSQLKFPQLLSRGSDVAVTKDNMTSGNGSGVPLRQRPLPASFWQEPNRPVVPMISDIFPLYLSPIMPRSFHEQMAAYKSFLDKLNKVTPIEMASPMSRYPITEFLYHNYGLRNKTLHSDYFRLSAPSSAMTSPSALTSPGAITSPSTLTTRSSLTSSSTINSASAFLGSSIPTLRLPGLNIGLHSVSENDKPYPLSSRPFLCDVPSGIVKPIATKSRASPTAIDSKVPQRFHPFLKTKLKPVES